MCYSTISVCKQHFAAFYIKWNKIVRPLNMKKYLIHRFSAGFGIPPSFFRAIRSFFVGKRAICSWKRANRSRSLFCKERQERIAHSRSFKKSKCAKSDRSHSLLGIKKWKKLWKSYKKWIFWANRTFFASDSLKSRANRYFLKSELLTVFLL